MKFKLWLVASLFALSSGLGYAAEQVKHRLLLQVSDDSVEKIMLALNTAKYVQQEFGAANVEIQIVVFGPGVQTLKYYAPIPVADRVKEAKYEGIRVYVDDYSMRAAKLKPAMMLREVAYVRSAATDIMEKVEQGWVLIRP
jgi:intracellular sulfur oxidation DsrE/DsrF family protein